MKFIPTLILTAVLSVTNAENLLVSPKAGLPAQAVYDISREHGARVLRKLDNLNVFVVEAPTDSLLKFKKHKAIKFAEVDALASPDYVPNDAYKGYHLGSVNAYNAWDTSEGEGITVAVCDTGAVQHPDLNLRLDGYNFYDNTTNFTDTYGHGTAVSGVIASLTNNTIGTAGIAGKSVVLPVKIASPTGYANWSAMASCIRYAADKGAKVVNISYSPVITSSTVLSAAQYLRNKGGVLVVSAGNDGINTNWTSTDLAVVVSAIDSNDARASWSNYGSFVDITAPGVGIYSTSYTGGYSQYNGTSFSSPIVAGMFAVLFSANPQLSPAQAETILFSTATDLGTTGKDAYYGYGKPNLEAAVLLAKDTNTLDTVPPVVTITNLVTGSKVSGNLSVSITATDNVSVSSVTLKVDGVTKATDSFTPYEFVLDTALLTDGSHIVQATAQDTSSNIGVSSTYTINVANLGDTTPPVANILYPLDGSSVKDNRPAKISVSSSDTSAVTQKLFIDNVLVFTSTSYAFEYNWKLLRTTKGPHIIKLEVTDSSNNTSTKQITVFVI